AFVVDRPLPVREVRVSDYLALLRGVRSRRGLSWSRTWRGGRRGSWLWRWRRSWGRLRSRRLLRFIAPRPVMQSNVACLDLPALWIIRRIGQATSFKALNQHELRHAADNYGCPVRL